MVPVPPYPLPARNSQPAASPIDDVRDAAHDRQIAGEGASRPSTVIDRALTFALSSPTFWTARPGRHSLPGNASGVVYRERKEASMTNLEFYKSRRKTELPAFVRVLKAVPP